MKKIFVCMFLIFYGTAVFAEEFDVELKKGIVAGMHHSKPFSFKNSVINNSEDEYTCRATLTGAQRIRRSSVKSSDPEMSWSTKKYNASRTEVVFTGGIQPKNKDYYISHFEGVMTLEEGGSEETDLTWDFDGQVNAKNLRLFVFGKHSDLEGATALPDGIADYFRGEKSRTDFGIGETISLFAFLDGKPYPLSKEYLQINTNEIIPETDEWEDISWGYLHGVMIPLKLGKSLQESENQESLSTGSFHREKEIAIKITVDGKTIICPSISIHYPYVYFDQESVYPSLDENGNILNPSQFHSRLLEALGKTSRYIEQKAVGAYFVVDDYLGPDVADFRELYVREEACDAIVTGFFQSSPHVQGAGIRVDIYEPGKGCCGEDSNDLIYHYLKRSDVQQRYSYEKALSASTQWNIPWIISKNNLGSDVSALNSDELLDGDEFFQFSSEVDGDDSTIVFAFLKQSFVLNKKANSSSVKCKATKLGISREYEYTFDE